MSKLFGLVILVLILFLPSGEVSADSSNSFVTVVNPIRGDDFWEEPNQSPIDVVKGQAEILERFNTPVTWLLRYDALKNSEIINFLRSQRLNQEFGLFLEITPKWTTDAQVDYRKSEVWHLAGSIFLTGYEVVERYKLIDKFFEDFHKEFGYYPKSVGGWWIDSNSLGYMQKKYGITGAMIVADQYTTDNYQVWGQYWSSPYLPARNNTLFPAQNTENKLPVVITQWAARDPVNGYGGGVNESTYSVQVNDYMDYHDLDHNYFSKLIDVYTLQRFNLVNHVVVGLENSYPWSRFSKGYEDQIRVLSQKRSSGQLSLVKLGDFNSWYLKRFSGVSPTQVLVSNDPLGTQNKTVWFMNPYYRSGFFYDNKGANFRDIRPYVEGQEELCYLKACQKVAATHYVTRVLDDVATGDRLILDQGKISDFSFEKNGEEYKINYKNEAGVLRNVVFKPRDITIDDTTRTIDLTISYAQDESLKQSTTLLEKNSKILQFQFFDLIFQTLKFLAFLVIAIYIPGQVFMRRIENLSFRVYLSLILGLVNITLVGFVLGILKLEILIYLYFLIPLSLYIKNKSYLEVKNLNFKRINYYLVAIIILGTIFQTVMVVRSGLLYSYGMGFWGPIGHDGVWHQALIFQLLQSIPPYNPGFSSEKLTNYHYFFDLLVAQSYKFTLIPVVDLLYRFYPIMFSILLGMGSYLLSKKIFNSKFISFVSLYLVYFAGSFGWIVEYLREGNFGGESAFWANQPVSFNLNPPFAISLLILIAIILLIGFLKDINSKIIGVSLIVLIGTLIEFKAYGSVLAFLSVGMLAVFNLFKKDFDLIKIIVPSGILSMVIFLPHNSGSASLLTFYPFWFIHSMVDYPDRVGWLKLSQARMAYEQRGDTLKFILAEGLGLFLFIVGNLGMRLFALFELVKGLVKFNSVNNAYLLLILISIFAMAIPIFLIQKGNPWNTIQFFYYGLFTSSFLAASVIFEIYKKLPKVVGVVLIVFILVVAPINAITTFRSGLYGNPPSRVSHAELEALSFLQKQPLGIVLTQPYLKDKKAGEPEPFKLYLYETSSYVSAFSGKTSYIEDEIQQDILQFEYKKRLVAANTFFTKKDFEWSKEFLKENNISYIYFIKYIYPDLNPDKIGITNLYENNEVVIYKVNR